MSWEYYVEVGDHQPLAQGSVEAVAVFPWFVQGYKQRVHQAEEAGKREREELDAGEAQAGGGRDREAPPPAPRLRA